MVFDRIFIANSKAFDITDLFDSYDETVRYANGCYGAFQNQLVLSM